MSENPSPPLGVGRRLLAPLDAAVHIAGHFSSGLRRRVFMLRDHQIRNQAWGHVPQFSALPSPLVVAGFIGQSLIT
jgi:hypothetical protein